MPVPRTLLNTGLALTSAGLSLGLHDNSADFLDDPEQQSSISQRQNQAGIAAVTTAGVLAGTMFASARGKNPALTALGMAISAGGAYATGRIYKQQQIQSMDENNTQPTLANKLLDSAVQLGAMYYGGRAIAPYVARSVSRMDMEFRPWFKAMGETIDQTKFNQLGEFSNSFTENLAKSREAFNVADKRYPLQNHLNMIYQVQKDISNVELRDNASQSIIDRLMKKYTIGSNEVTNGLRRATLEDAIRAGQAVQYSQLTRRGIPLNKVGLGKGIFYDTNAQKIINLHKYTPENVLAGVTKNLANNFKIPILGFNPISVLRPNELIEAARAKNTFHIFPEGTPLGFNTKAGKRGAAYIGGDLFDINSGKRLTSGLIVKTGSLKQEVINGQAKNVFRETQAGEILRKRYQVGMDKIAQPGFEHVGNKEVPLPKGRLQKFMSNTLEMDLPFIHSTGRAEYSSTWDKLWSAVRNREGGKSSLEAIKDAMKTVFDPESLIEHKSNISAFPLKKTQFGEVAHGFVAHSDLPGTLAFWQSHRPVRLFESLGLGGFNAKTSRSAGDMMWKMVMKRALPMYLSYKMIQFTNDMSHKYLGYGPLDIPADIVAGANVATSYMRRALGIDKLANYLENLMPGSISGAGPSLIRGLGLPLLAGAKFGPRGLAVGGAISMLLGGPSSQILKTPEDIKAEYFGNKRVGIRSGRWWEMGSGPFEGGKIKYYIPNWYRRMKSRYQYTDTQYGSEGEYWSNIMNPYHYAIKHYADRPYPLVTSGFEEFPFVGQLLGGLVAPPMLMHQGAGSGQRGANSPGFAGTGAAMPTGIGSVGLPGGPEQKAPYGVAYNLGGLPRQQGISPASLQGRIGAEMYQAQEYLGMYGFLAGSLKANLTGNQNYFTQPQLESASRIGSAERVYWEKDFGGLFENTELFRRFLPHRRHDIDYQNNIPNQMPDWIPGSDYFQNLKIGDPYAKINYGEFRLPGEAYKKFYTPGEGIQKAAVEMGKSNLMMNDGYSPLDQYRILSDVAPYSNQAKYTSQYIMALSKAGGLTAEAEQERKAIRKETSARKKAYRFSARKFTEGSLQNESVTVNQYLGKGRFTVKGQKDVYTMAGLKGITAEGDEYLGSIIKPGENITVQTLADKRYRRKTSTTIPTVPVLVGPLNRNLINKGYAEYNKTGPADVYDPLNMKVKYNPVERAIGSAWEGFSHIDTPFNSKFLNQKTALEQYKKDMVYDTQQADWQHPISSFVMPFIYKGRAANPIVATLAGAAMSLFGTNKITRVGLGIAGAFTGLGLSLTAGKDYIPDYRKKERDVDQYFDILNYLKNKRLYEYSREKAIQEEGIDPEKLMQSVEASQEARRNIAKALKSKYSDEALDELYDKALKIDAKETKRAIRNKHNIAEGIKFMQNQKYTEDEALRETQGGFTGAALEFRKRMKSTAYGADVHGDFASIMRALPTKEREFFSSFVTAPKHERAEIKKLAPLGMRRFLEAKWGEQVEDNPDLETYFKDHKLPNDSWVGWHPAVNLNDVKLKVVQQQGLQMHDFNMWDSQVRELARKPYVPLIDPFSAKGNHHNIKQEIQDIVTAQGYNNYEVDVQAYSGNPNNSIDIDVKYATDTQARDYIKSHLGKLVSPAYAS